MPRPDVVVALTAPPIIGLATLLTARRFGAKFVLLCQDVFPEAARLLEGFQQEAVNRLLDLITRFLLRKADRVVALGEMMRERLIVGIGVNARQAALAFDRPLQVRAYYNLLQEVANVPLARP